MKKLKDVFITFKKNLLKVLELMFILPLIGFELINLLWNDYYNIPLKSFLVELFMTFMLITVSINCLIIILNKKHLLNILTFKICKFLNKIHFGLIFLGTLFLLETTFYSIISFIILIYLTIKFI